MSVKKKKILYFIPSLSVGGLEIQLTQHVNVLIQDKKYDVSIMTLSDNVKLDVKNHLPKEIKIYNLQKSYSLGIRAFTNLFLILNKIRPDVVISSTFPCNISARILKPLFKYRLISREHNIYPERTKFNSFLNKLTLRKIFNDEYIALSQQMASNIEKQSSLLPSSMRIINNGISISKWDKGVKESQGKDEIRNKFNISQNTKVVLNVARFKKKKNQLLLLEAFAEYKKNCEDCLLILIGGGEEKSNLEATADELKVKNSVLFVDRVHDVASFYICADIFVLTSTQEGFPNVLLEALYFKLPIIATEAPGVEEVILSDKIGKLCPPDKTSLSEEMLNTFDKLQNGYFPNSFQSEVLKKFDIEKIVDDYKKLF